MNSVKEDNYIVRNATKVLLERVAHANNFLSRFKGLLGVRELSAKEGLLITPCSQVHTIGMNFPIDVIFLNKDMQVMKLVENLAPYRATACFPAHHTLEIAAGQIAMKNIRVSDVLSLEIRNG